MATVVTILDGRRGWAGDTDIVVVVEPTNNVLRWVPRDLWCEGIRDRVNAAFRRGGHPALISALKEHGMLVEHSLCLRREATERTIRGMSVRVPVLARLEFWYPISLDRPIQEAAMRISFDPPFEVLEEERIHQWIGARSSVRSDTTDFDRIRRQQTLLRSLLLQGFDFRIALANAELVDLSSDGALAELREVNAAWRLDVLDHVSDARIDGKLVLLRREAPRQARSFVPILMYHRIGAPPRRFRWPDLYVRPLRFARQLDVLAKRGYTAVTLRDLYDGLHGDRALPDKPVVFTFDDGHISVWTEAFPLLRSKGWPAVLNLPTSMLDSPIGVSSDMVHLLVAAGWELGAHSRTHPDLTEVDPERLEREVTGSRSDLSGRFGVPADFFCYPSGRYSPDVIEAVARAGYLGATTTEPGLAGPENPYAMPRVRVSRGDSPRQLHKRLARLEQQAPSVHSSPSQ